MTFDLQTTLLIAGAALAVIVLLWLVLRATSRQSIARDEKARLDADQPYVASKERPYVKPPAPPAVEPGRPLPADPVQEREAIDVAQPAVPLPGDLAGIAFPPHSTDHPDDLTRLKGVGPKLAALLNQEGITRYEQLASLDEADLAALDDRLGTFKGRLARDRVAEQARYLASGDTTGFEGNFGKLGG